MSSSLYEALPLGNDSASIRLLALEPSNDYHSPIVCCIQVAQISDKLQYEALSYCWGSEKSTEEVTIYCEKERSKTTLTSNLVSALHALRCMATVRILWIDAICINQNNLEEKQLQVPLMRQIYSKCTRVIAWLGESDKDSRKAFAQVQKAETKEKYPLLLNSILRRPWFQRVWVIQEVALAPEVMLQCGDNSIQWHQLMEAVSLLTDVRLVFNPFSRPDAKHFHQALYAKAIDMTRVRLQNENRFALREALRNFQLFEATEILDKIYSVQGLLEMPNLIEPDYTKSAKSVYCNTAVSIIQVEEKLDIFLDAVAGVTGSLIPDLPSWVPDWSSVDQVQNNPAGFMPEEEIFSASQDTTVDKLTLVDNQELILSGIIVGSIVELGRHIPSIRDIRQRYWPGIIPSKRAFDALTDFLEILQSWRDVLRLPRIASNVPEYEKYPTGERLVDVFYRTLFRLGAPPSDDGKKDRSFDILVRLLESATCLLERNSRYVLQRLPWFLIWFIIGPLTTLTSLVLIFQALREGIDDFFGMNFAPNASRQGFVPGRTDSGLFGTFPAPYFTAPSAELTMVEDVIVIFKGSARPFIIHPCQNGKWRLIGDAYIHGIMFGAAFDEEKCRDIHLI